MKNINIKNNIYKQNFDIRLLHLAPKGHKINLGCGKKLIPNFINVDQFEYPNKSITKMDLFKEHWDFENDKFSYCFASHFFEHVLRGKEWYNVCNNLFRIMKHNGIIEIRSPYPSIRTLIDADHHRLIDAKTFLGLVRNEIYGLGSNNIIRNGYIKLIYRQRKGQYHMQKYFKVSLPPYWGIHLGFKVIKE